jgi:hypothetical protein
MSNLCPSSPGSWSKNQVLLSRLNIAAWQHSTSSIPINRSTGSRLTVIQLLVLKTDVLFPLLLWSLWFLLHHSWLNVKFIKCIWIQSVSVFVPSRSGRAVLCSYLGKRKWGNCDRVIMTVIRYVYLYFECFIYYMTSVLLNDDGLCGLVVRVPCYRSRGPVSIPGATGFCEK